MKEAFEARVLVLNRLWQAVHIVGAKRALTLLCAGHARVLHASPESWQVWPAEDWLLLSDTQPASPTDHYLHTVRKAIRVPKIVLLNGYAELPLKEVHLTRQTIFERDQYRCQYCGGAFRAHDLNLDHVFPKERGGQMSWENIVTSCIKCNTFKANRTPAEAKMHLLKKPKQPRSRPFVAYMIGQQMQEEWRAFLESRHDEAEVEIIRSALASVPAAQLTEAEGVI